LIYTYLTKNTVNETHYTKIDFGIFIFMVNLLSNMDQVTDSDDVEDGEAKIQLGMCVPSVVGPLSISKNTLEEVENNEFQEFLNEVEEWWDKLTVEERAEVIDLGEKNGNDIINNLEFIDKENELGKMELVADL